jgi:hypothetical protein
MLWEHNSTIIVMLTKLREMGRVSLLLLLGPLSHLGRHQPPFGEMPLLLLSFHTPASIRSSFSPLEASCPRILKPSTPFTCLLHLILGDGHSVHRRSATSIGQQSALLATNTLLLTRWRNTTCPSISCVSSRSQMPG